MARHCLKMFLFYLLVIELRQKLYLIFNFL